MYYVLRNLYYTEKQKKYLNMLKLFSCKMCKDRERFSSFESSYCFALFQNTLTLKNSFIRVGFNGFI